MASETISPPASWTVTDVASWATRVRLAPKIVTSLFQNEVDGATLITLTKSDLQSELGITSLPARRYMWELIRSLKSEQVTCDYSVAIEVHEQEIQSLSVEEDFCVATEGPDAASGFCVDVDASSFSTVVDELNQDVQKQRQVIEDHMMAFNLQKMMNNGYDVCKDAELAHQEQERLDQLLVQAENDREYAESLAGGRERAAVEERRRFNPFPDDLSTLSRTDSHVSSLFGMCVGTCADNKINVAEAFRTGKVKPMKLGVIVSDDESSDSEEWDYKPAAVPGALFNLPYIEHCNICYEENLKGYILACGHLQCIECTRKLFRTALGDNDMIPLRCCQIPIDMNIANDLLEPDEAKFLTRCVQEKQASNKMYCPSCSSFINLDLVDSSQSSELRCACGAMICIACKKDAHSGFTCEENRAIKSGSDDLVLRLSREKGWKQCPGCDEMIELRSGCNHMKCSRCRHEFCYRCLKSWNTSGSQCASANCDLWDEDQLLEG